MNFKSSRFTPLLNEEKGITGVIEASTILFFCYLGFDFITTMSEEAHNPKTSVPLAVNISVTASMIIYALIAFAVTGVGNLGGNGSGGGETALA